MSRSIDERIVQMTFNNKDFEKNANQTIGTLDKLKSSLNFDGIINNFKNLGNAANSIDMSGVSNAFDGIADKVSYVEAIVQGFFFRIGQQAADFGVRFAKSLSIDQVTAGWNKYTQQTGSIQTLVNSTGKTVEEIEKATSKLMRFSDETSFGFTDMTSALSTMVASGGDIEKLIPMIEGIANATAYAGKGASEFSRVIYNLNQSYSSGFLNLQDWKSVQLAGVNSKGLIEELIKAGEELGKIQKGEIDLTNFTDSLKTKWADTAVMEKAFGKFASLTEAAQKAVDAGEFETFTEAYDELSKVEGAFEDISIKAAKSAQEAKSFQEVIDATKDAVSSKWMQTFSAIFGNYDEAKALWSRMAEDFYTIFAQPMDSVVEFFNEWHSLWKMSDDEAGDYNNSLTQMEALWRSIAGAIEGISSAISKVVEKSGLKDLMPTAQGLYSFIEKLRYAFWDIYAFFSGSADNRPINMLTDSVANLLSVVKVVARFLTKLKDELIKPIITMLTPLGEKLRFIFSYLSQTFKVINTKALNDDLSVTTTIFQKILDVVKPVIDAIGTLLDWITNLSFNIWKAAYNSDLFTAAIDGAKAVLNNVGNIIKSVTNIFTNFKDTLSKVKDIIKPVFDYLSKGFDKLKASMKDIFSEGGTADGLNKTGLFAVLSLIFIKLKNLNFKDVFKNITDGFLSGAKELVNSIGGIVSSVENIIAGRKKDIFDKFQQLSKSILMVAASLLVIASINPTDINRSLETITIVIGELIGSLVVIDSFSKNKKANNAPAILLSLAGSLLLISFALKVLAGANPEGLDQAIKAISIVMLELLAFIGILSKVVGKASIFEKSTDFKAIGKAIKSIGLGLILIGAALKIMASIDPKSFGQAILAMTLAIIEIGAMIGILSDVAGEAKASGSQIKAIGSAVLGISVGLIAVAAALKILSTIDNDTLFVDLLAVAGILTAVGIFAKQLSNSSKDFILISAGMLILAPALLVMAAALGVMALIPADKLGKAFLAISGLLLVLGVFASAVAPMSTAFLAISASILILSASFLIFAEGVKVLAEGILQLIPALAAFAVMGETISSALGQMIVQIAAIIVGAIPNLIAGIVLGLVQGLGSILNAIKEAVILVCDLFIELFPKIIETLGVLLGGLFDFLFQFIGNLIEPIIQLATQLIMAVLEGIKQIVPEVVSVLYDILVAFIKGVTAVIKNSADFYEAVGELVAAIGESLFKGIGSLGKGLFGSIADLFSGDDKKAEQAAENTGSNTAGSIMDGIKSKLGDVTKTTSSVLTTSAKDAQTPEVTSAFGKAGDFSVDGLLGGLLSDENKNRLKAAGLQEYLWVEEGYQSGADQHSPSRKMMKNGRFTIQGLLNGLKAMEPKMREEGAKLYDVLDSALDLANGMDDEFTPVITPVLDLSNIDPNAVSNALGTSSLNGAMSISSGLNAVNQNGANNPVNLTLNTSFNVNTNQEITKSTVQGWASWIADSLNEELGRRLR